MCFKTIHAVIFTLDLQSRPLPQSSRAQKTMSCENRFSDLDYTFACTPEFSFWFKKKKQKSAVSFLVTRLCTFVTVKINEGLL